MAPGAPRMAGPRGPFVFLRVHNRPYLTKFITELFIFKSQNIIRFGVNNGAGSALESYILTF